MKYQNNPFISALLVTRNEESTVIRALNSYINQTYPKDYYEIIIIDGMSEDRTPNLVNEFIEKYKNIISIRFLQNPKKTLASGWNLGIKEAKGEYVVRIDAHAEASPNLIQLSVNTMLEVNEVCVGGILITKTADDKENIISKVLSSPFGVGNSYSRVSKKPMYVDTVAYGLYKKEIFEKVGYFNENMLRNQDLEMHSRIKQAGGKFYMNPQIVSVYYSRNTLRKMIKQAYGNGKWGGILFKKDSSALAIRHFIPCIFDLSILGCVILGFINVIFWWLVAIELIIYFLLGLYFSIKSTKNVQYIILMPLVFFILHTTYGCGTLMGLISKINIKQE